ncbi:hypothetical protein [Cylindrospermum stagnale]|uniref:hypothetical protein n=1 Tax=Cylindrospermum stagnale TaxID=142864 RepID=UPI001C1041D4|nr:hypothetical protein [Cylindrospermum stagnale]
MPGDLYNQKQKASLLPFRGVFCWPSQAIPSWTVLSFIEKLLKWHRETGTIAPKKRTKQTPTKLNTEQLSVLKQIVEVNNDAMNNYAIAYNKCLKKSRQNKSPRCHLTISFLKPYSMQLHLKLV